MMAPGSVVEPAAIKRFKSRLNDGHIVDVNELDFYKWQKYFKERIGVDIALPEKEPVKEPEKEAVKEPAEAPEKAVKNEPIKAAAVVVKAR